MLEIQNIFKLPLHIRVFSTYASVRTSIRSEIDICHTVTAA